jgi:hypothetical protein
MTTNPQIREQPAQDQLGSFYMGRMRQSAPPPRRLLPRGLLTGMMLACFAAIIYYAYPQGPEKYSDLDIPVIAASKEPYKFKPDDPGGMEVRHQDSTIFDPLEKDAARHVEKLRPKPEEPINRSALHSSAPIDHTPHSLDLKTVSRGTERLIGGDDKESKPAAKPVVAAAATPAAKLNTPSPAKPAVASAKPAPQTPPVQTAVPKTVSAQTAASQPVVASAAPADKPPPVKAAAAPAAAPAVAAATAKPGGKSGATAYIQLGAFRDAKAARAEWTVLQKKYPGILGKLDMRTQEVDLGAKGKLTRLQAGASSEAGAKTLCDSLKPQGQACIVAH